MKKPTPINQVPSEELRIGQVCLRGHTQNDGQGVRYKSTGHCIGCYYKINNGPMNIQFDNLDKPYPSKYANEGERKAAHIQRVMAWQKNHKPQVDVHRKTYAAKEVVIKMRAKKSLDQYYEAKNAFDNNPSTPEEIILAERHAKRRVNQHNYYMRNKEKCQEYSRLKYLEKMGRLEKKDE